MIFAKRIFYVALLLWSLHANSNDSAAGIAANGVYLKEEKSISIEKEDLYISEEKITVAYRFRNLSSSDITTVVAFPMPDYSFDVSGQRWYPMYDDFVVEVNGKPIRHSEEIKAFVNGTDHTKLLENFGISIKRFGDFGQEADNKKNYFSTLTQAQRETLLQNKLIIMDGPLPIPAWKVSRKYFWTQTFPHNNDVEVKHTYRPYKGHSYIPSEEKFYQAACIDKDADRWIKGIKGPRYYRYVDYILTTANNWSQPIKNFRLTLDGVKSEDTVLVSACFPGKRKKIGPNVYQVTVTNFVPKKNLTVYFIRK